MGVESANSRGDRVVASTEVGLVFPRQFVERYRGWLGEELDDFLAACGRPLRKSFQTNTLKVTKAALEERARRLAWVLNPIPWSAGGYWIDRDDPEEPLGHSLEHYGGWIYIQEASSMAPVDALEPFPGMTLLDISAAPGGKTVLAGIRAGDRATIIANDVATGRLKSMVSNIERMGLTSALVTQENGNRFGGLFANHFDRVLVDAPCSAEGTIRKDRTALTWWSVNWIERAARTQKALVLSGYRALKPGGTLVYSTCTLAREENEGVIEFLLERHPEAQVEPVSLRGLICHKGIVEAASEEVRVREVARIYPHLNDTEGFCIARIRKTRETEERRKEEPRLKTRARVLSAEERRKVLRYYRERYGWTEDLFDGLELAMMGRSLWIWRTGARDYFRILKVNRAGLRMVREVGSSAPKVSTWAAQRWGRRASRNVVRLCRKRGDLYLTAKDLDLTGPERVECGDGVVLVEADGITVGTGLLRGTHLKNQLPRSTVIPG
jgi:16S rRNA (cytosine1407-C5)-methyltransferase